MAMLHRARLQGISLLKPRWGGIAPYDPSLAREQARAIEQEAESRLGPKGIYPNVDFYSGLVYRKLGIPRDLFTPVFAIARVAGWLAHWREQLGANRIFRPSQIYSGSQPRSWMPIEERVSAPAA